MTTTPVGVRSAAQAAVPLAALSVLLLCVVWSYWPGLTGPFLLDDATNIAPLGDNGGIRTLGDFKRYVFGGNAGPLGRPVSLASFVANAQTWPADPWPFKLTNLLIHLLNTVLVYTLARQLLTVAKSRWPLHGALLAAAWWGLHPLHASTVLYVVQRMTELAATFSLFGLILFVHGRRTVEARPTFGFLWMCVGIGMCGLLAALSKESGALLPLLALCIELLLRRAVSSPPLWRPISILILWMPVAAIAFYFAWQWPDMLRGYAGREFSISERLLTEGRVLTDYLRNLLLPTSASAGLFNDNYPLSRSLLSPVSTLWSWLLVAGLIVIAVVSRKRHPVLALGLFWFFCAHLLESTFLPLEIYFEHRNYLPAFGLALIAGYYVPPLIPSRRVLLIAGFAAFVGLEIWITRQKAVVWGDEWVAVTVWPMERPESLRVQQFAARYWLANGNPAAAANYIEAFAKQDSRSATARLQAIELRCATGEPVDGYAREASSVLRHGKFDLGGLDSLGRTQRAKTAGHCADLQSETLMGLIDAYLDNPQLKALPSQVGYLYFIKASELAARGEYDLAVRIVTDAARLRPSLLSSYWQALWMLQANKLPEARQYLSEALDAHYRQFGTEAPLDAELQDLKRRVGH